MNRKILVYLLLLVIVTIGIIFTGAAKSGKSTTLTRAKQNDTVWVLLNHVKADKCQQFEKFIHEIFWPASKNLSEYDQKVFNQTRVLHPTAKEEDGTYTYVFIMDPVIPGADYSIENFLVKEYGKQKGEEYGKMYTDCLTGDQTGWTLTQTEL